MAEGRTPDAERQVLRDQDTTLKPSLSNPSPEAFLAEVLTGDRPANSISKPVMIQEPEDNNESEDASNNLRLQKAAAALDEAQKEWLTAAEALVSFYDNDEAAWKLYDNETLGKIIMASQLVVTTFTAYKQCRAGHSQVKAMVAYSKDHGNS